MYRYIPCFEYEIKIIIIISKSFEKVIHDQLYDYFDKYNLITEQQYGFRKQHSTEYTAVKLVDYVSKEMEIGKTPTNVYIDLSKAFGTLTFDILLFKLKYYGVTDTAFDFMRSYLTNRKQYMLYLIVVNLTILKYILEYHRDPYWVPYYSIFTLMTKSM